MMISWLYITFQRRIELENTLQMVRIGKFTPKNDVLFEGLFCLTSNYNQLKKTDQCVSFCCDKCMSL